MIVLYLPKKRLKAILDSPVWHYVPPQGIYKLFLEKRVVLSIFGNLGWAHQSREKKQQQQQSWRIMSGVCSLPGLSVVSCGGATKPASSGWSTVQCSSQFTTRASTHTHTYAPFWEVSHIVAIREVRAHTEIKQSHKCSNVRRPFGTHSANGNSYTPTHPTPPYPLSTPALWKNLEERS